MPITAYSTPDIEVLTPFTISATGFPYDMTALTFPVLEDDVTIAKAVSIIEPSGESENITVHHAPTHSDFFYNRIHIIPSLIDYGYILSETQEDYYIWNAYIYEDKTCTAVVDVNMSEVDISGRTPSFTILALGTEEFTATVDEDGSASFISTREYTFGEDVEPQIQLQGVRVAILYYRPQAPVYEDIEFLTSILANVENKEQRIAARQIPRQSFGHHYLLDNDMIKRVLPVLYSQSARAFGVPVWQEEVWHSGDISAGATTITLDTTYSGFVEGEYALIWQDVDTWEAVKIETLSATDFDLETALSGSFTGGCWIMPMKVAYINERGYRKRRYANGVTEIDKQFKVTVNQLISGYTPTETLNSKLLITDPAGIERVQDRDVQLNVFVSDYETGKFVHHTDAELLNEAQSYIFWNDTPQAAWNFKKMIHYLMGRQKSFYLPTFRDDIVLTEEMETSDFTFTAVNYKHDINYNMSAHRKYLFFKYTDGTYLVRQITNIVETSESIETFTIDSSIGKVTNNNNCTISYIDHVRLLNDKIRIQWDRVGYNQSKLQLVGVDQ